MKPARSEHICKCMGMIARIRVKDPPNRVKQPE